MARMRSTLHQHSTDFTLNSQRGRWGRWDSVVGVVIEFLTGLEIAFSSKAARSGLGPIQPATECVTRMLFSGVKGMGREADHWLHPVN
jgi:hypothetical protein